MAVNHRRLIEQMTRTIREDTERLERRGLTSTDRRKIQKQLETAAANYEHRKRDGRKFGK